ncbi:cell adhesion molecule L1-like a isoform X1 [Xiphophorus couchianus]|uniref:cell adhesion molecule L1-like a isoform X1 n=1 Tax=Xiphophorus couchianus TaxID=32473 RepID=UPI00101649C4|nr:neural cell adhesion molecule L1-like protein isoform X1 [Xiphophorus couchianus]XP_027872102.1 neural cell adhesion molecule L1-like protein isoform X1 [Xiphophorus couchianus]XP_027872108.1 neural cell adhesion molecule L1-like protein isoform X1 [Xiphophorus couchianus]
MRRPGDLLLVLLWTFTSRARSLNIPFEVEQPPTITNHTAGPIIALPFDNTLTIRCEARGNPPPAYTWTKDGQELNLPNIPTVKTDNRNGTFMFHNKHFAQFRGKYRCFASNKLGTAMTEEIEIVLSTSPKFPKETFDTIVVKEGYPITLHCNPPEGVAPRQIYWMTHGLQHIKQDERVSMGTDGNLYFAYALPQDSRKDYGCVAAFQRIRTIVQKTPLSVKVERLEPENNSSESVSATLPVRAPSLLLPSGVQTEKLLLKGQDLHLECIPAGYPTPKITWMKMGETLTDRTKLDNFKKLLTISAVDEKDQGKYMCMAENSAGKADHYFDVIVEEPPSWRTKPPQNQLSVIGSDVFIKCSVDGKPTPVITWRKNGKILQDDRENNRRVLDETVMLHKAGPEDSGVYQCEASNPHGSVLANINVLVMNMAPLMLTKDFQEYAVIEGEDIVMNCSVFSSPPSSVSWTKEGTVVEGERFHVLENGQFLKIIRSEKGDMGKYACMASNREGMSNLTALLDVKDPTKIVAPPQDVQISSGKLARLMCRSEYDRSLQGTFEVIWRKDGEEIFRSSENSFRYNMEGDQLQIRDLNISDQGRYTCIARTSLDEDTATAFLTVLDTPDAPMSLKISDQESRNVTLSWIPGSDHNSSVREFVVEYEESHWEPGRWKELQKVAGNQATAELFLHGDLNYQFRVYAVNAIGPGPPSEPTERLKTPPAAPDRNPENIRIHGHFPHEMDISWDPLLPIEFNGPGLEYKLSYRKLEVEDKWQEHLVTRPSFIVRNTSTFAPYEIKIQSRNSLGWGPEPRPITGYSGEDIVFWHCLQENVSVPTAAPHNVAVEVINTTVLRVSWSPVLPATVRGHLGGYNVNWERMKSFLSPDKILEEHKSKSFPGNRTHVIVPGFEPFSEYRLTVNVFNKKGKGPKSDPVNFYTPEGVPEKVPVLIPRIQDDDTVLLEWGPPSVTNGILTGYFLKYHLLNKTSLEVIDSFELNLTLPDVTQHQIVRSDRGNLFRFYLSACTRAGCGPAELAENHSPPAEKVGTEASTSTQRWFIGTLCAVALLTLLAVIVCFVMKTKGGKYAVKEKEDLFPDAESQAMNDDAYEYSGSDEKRLKKPILGSTDDTIEDRISRDSLADYSDGDGEFSEDGSFIGEYAGARYRDSISEPSGASGPSTATA